MSNHLLPPSASSAERAFSEATSRIDSISVPLRTLVSPDDCPIALLPWLAWSLSVDEWNEEWGEAQKRQTTARSISVHRKKGTRGAVEEALGALGFGVRIIEWWEMEPKDVPGTFNLEVQLPAGYKVDEATYQEVERIVNAAKNCRSHLSKISLTPAALTQQPIVCGAVFCGETVTIYELGRIKTN